MIINNDPDRKKIDSIKKTIKKFNSEAISLKQLTDNLYDLFQAITNLNNEWEDHFFQKWLDLESVYTYITDKKNGLAGPEEKKIINNAISEISKLVDQALDNYLQIRNPHIKSAGITIDSEWLQCPECHNAWQEDFRKPMIICPACDTTIHNPRYKKS
jgi:predicted Zn-ribbon and HTH transcriptional regulator